MSTAGDHTRGMTASWVTDEAVEAAMRGDHVDGPLAPVASFGRQVQALGDRPAPPPSRALAALFAAQPAQPCLDPNSAPVRTINRRRLAAKIAISGAIATLGITGTAAAGVLPEPARTTLRDAVEAVTPLDLTPTRDPANDDDNPPATATDPGPTNPGPTNPGPTNPDPTNPDPTDPDPTTSTADPDPGGHATDPDPGGQATDPDPGRHDPDPDPDPDPGEQATDPDPDAGPQTPQAPYPRGTDAGDDK